MTRTAPTAPLPSEIDFEMRFDRQGGEDPTPYEVLLHAALIGDSSHFTREDSVEETWRVVQPLLDSPPPVAPLREGLLGAGGGRQAGRAVRRLALALAARLVLLPDPAVMARSS